MAILDASFLVKLVLNEECTWSALRELRGMAMRGEELHAPCIAVAEVLNAVWKHSTLLREIDESEARRALERLKRIQQVLVLHDVVGLASRALEAALNYGITFYDALYVVLAEELKQPLYTYDTRLADRLRRMNARVNVVVPGCEDRV